jgi:hypothetical protein
MVSLRSGQPGHRQMWSIRSQCAVIMMFMLSAVLVLLPYVSASYFVVSTERKCFTIEQPRDTPVIFAYEIMDDNQEIEFSTFYGALAVPDLRIQSVVLTAKFGHEELLTDNDGYYSVCLTQVTKNPEYPARVRVVVTYGHDAEYYQKLTVEQKFDTINLEVHKLNDMMTMTLNEADYQKHKEVEYHEQTEQMDTATLWWPVVQVRAGSTPIHVLLTNDVVVFRRLAS